MRLGHANDILYSIRLYNMKLSLIATILNEEDTVKDFLSSIAQQTLLPNEVVLVDGGSSDNTCQVIEAFKKTHSNLSIKLFKKKGNRSIGRNEAIKRAIGDILLISDAGCILDRHWVKNSIEPFTNSAVDVVAGYYKGKAETVFQKCLIPYVLVMEDQIDPSHFLPASRSMAIRRKVWEEMGGFDEKYSHNEDYVFAKKLESNAYRIAFVKNAIVYWIPRRNLMQAFHMFWRFAYGDSESGILRPKVVLLFIRYLLFLLLLLIAIIFHQAVLGYIIGLFIVLYLFWSVLKNYRYVLHPAALLYLPLLQLTTDIAVITGSFFGYVKKN